ncbi:hypothetical protein [Afifella sp. IM 167]|uniref:hypothetical protein n=1 Tax=Afifella sp. IM 167 TaxID=2033586 RepID=UPI001CCE5AC6|nr:hypothetical protein [Afifella sp. IM 167]
MSTGRRIVPIRPLSWARKALFAAGLSLASMAQPAASAPAAGELSVELNRLAENGDACRMSLVYTNGLGVTVEALELETVLFDREGGASRFLVVKSQPLIPGKIRVSQYDLAGMACADVGFLLINDVVACKGEGLDPAACLARLSPSSRTRADLVVTEADREPASAGSE